MADNTRRKGIVADSIREYTLLAVIKRLIAYIRPYSVMALTSFILSIVSSALLVLRPYLIKIAIDNHIVTGNLDGLNLVMILFIIFYIIRLIVGYFIGLTTGLLGQNVMHDLRMDIFGHILSMEMSFFDHNKVGRLMTRTTDDVNALNEL